MHRLKTTIRVRAGNCRDPSSSSWSWPQCLELADPAPRGTFISTLCITNGEVRMFALGFQVPFNLIFHSFFWVSTAYSSPLNSHILFLPPSLPPSCSSSSPRSLSVSPFPFPPLSPLQGGHPSPQALHVIRAIILSGQLSLPLCLYPLQCLLWGSDLGPGVPEGAPQHRMENMHRLT